MDTIEQYIKSRRNIPPALAEALLDAYKICHQDELDGTFDDSRQPGLMLNAIDGTLTSPPNNILTESSSVNSPDVNREKILHNLAEIMEQFDSDKSIARLLDKLNTHDMTEACDALYSIVNFAMFRDKTHTNSDESIYTNIVDGDKILINFRNANHYTNPHNLVKKTDNNTHVPVVDAEYHMSLNSNNVEKQHNDTKEIQETKRNQGDSASAIKNVKRRNGTRFRTKPELNRIEIILNVKQFYGNKHLVKLLLLALLRIVSRKTYNPEYIKKMIDDGLNGYCPNGTAAVVKYVDTRDVRTNNNKIGNPWSAEEKEAKEESVMVCQYLAFVDRLGEITSQPALCEAVKEGFSVCFAMDNDLIYK